MIPVSATPVKASGSARRLARRLARAPVLRLLAPGWPDAGRRIVQTRPLEALLARATADGVPPTTALNAGVGEGLYSPMLRRFAGNALLLEFDFAVPPKSADPRACRFSASLTAIPLPSGSVDLAICTEVLEHVADDRRAVAELRRVLAPGGFLVLSVPTPPAVFDPGPCSRGIHAGSAVRALRREGLTIVDAGYCMYSCFQAVLTILAASSSPAWGHPGPGLAGSLVPLGSPMDLVVLARPRA